MDWFLIRSAVIFAPMGYPQRNPATTAKVPSPETRNKIPKGTDSTFEIILIPPVAIRRSVINRKGNSVGNKIWNHKRSPSLAPLNTSFGQQSISRKTPIIPIPARFFFESFCFILHPFCHYGSSFTILWFSRKSMQLSGTFGICIINFFTAKELSQWFLFFLFSGHIFWKGHGSFFVLLHFSADGWFQSSHFSPKRIF